MTPETPHAAYPTPPLPWTTAEVVQATGGTLCGGRLEERFTAVAIDSRTIAAGQLFVAIRGQVHDGHRFAADVVAAGIRGVVLERAQQARLPVSDWLARGVSCIAVDDTTEALGALGAFNRRRATVRLVAITGSNGKTTTRAMTQAVLGQRYSVLATQGNLNNNIGLPLTLLRLGAEHRWAVVELGMNHPGEIRALAHICQPDIGIITTIAPAHLEGLGSIDGVRQAKAELLEGLPADGRAVLNADDPHCRRIAAHSPVPVLLYGLASDAEIRAEAVTLSAAGTHFTLVLPSGAIPVSLPLPGEFMVGNALAAAAVGHLAGLSTVQIARGLEVFTPAAGRMRVLRTAAGVHLLDDTYNANPKSMALAIATVMQLAAGRRAVVVAGDMRELGPQAAVFHRQIGVQVAHSGAARLCAVGDFAADLCQGALSAGMPPERVMHGTKREVSAALRRWLEPGDWVLVKGSRAMAMEEVVGALQAGDTEG
jgi:UDP-N-acetylmuramoyl-tripeptide--D-alanyl-D-alanine ligase